MPSGGREYSQERLAELIMYVANRLMSDPRYGSTKLNKVLFFSDFEAFRRTGQSITGAVYHHLDQGPCPHQFLPALRSLPEREDWVWRSVPTYGGTARQVVPLRPARVELFTGPEIALVEEFVSLVRDLDNRQASDLSHETMAYKVTDDRDEVPYGAALVSSDSPTADDLAWAEEVAERAGLGPAAR